jgi:hypothetical protein
MLKPLICSQSNEERPDKRNRPDVKNPDTLAFHLSRYTAMPKPGDEYHTKA